MLGDQQEVDLRGEKPFARLPGVRRVPPAHQGLVVAGEFQRDPHVLPHDAFEHGLKVGRPCGGLDPARVGGGREQRDPHHPVAVQVQIDLFAEERERREKRQHAVRDGRQGTCERPNARQDGKPSFERLDHRRTPACGGRLPVAGVFGFPMIFKRTVSKRNISGSWVETSFSRSERMRCRATRNSWSE